MGGYGVALTAPELLIVGALLLALTLALSAAARHHLSRGRRRLSLALRATMLAALVLALAGLQLIAPIDRLTTVFVVDLSDSVGAAGQESALAFVREALEERKGGDRAAVVAFGREALVERLPAEFDDIDRFASVPLKTSTDIGGALRLASALFPDDTQKRIVLVSDGNDTTGRGQSEASLASARGIQIETYVVGLGAADEVIVQSLRSPDTARVGENISVEATISSTVAQPATVRLFGDGRQIGIQSVDLEAGITHVAFTVPATDGRLPYLPSGGRGRSRHFRPEQPRRFAHHRQGRSTGAAGGRLGDGRLERRSRAEGREPGRSRRSRPKRRRPT